MPRPVSGSFSVACVSRLFCCAAVVAAWLSSTIARAAIPSDELLQSLQPQGAVSDFAGLLAPADRTAIDGRLRELRQRTSAQFALVTLDSLKGGQIDDFTNKLFKKWGVGEKKGKNNGVMLLVAIKDRKARIEVGYGLEAILPDALAGRVLDEQLFPSFKQQHYAQGLRLAVNRIAEIIERGEPAPPQVQRDNTPPRAFAIYLTVFLSIFVAIGFAAVGAGVGTRQIGAVLFGLFFGGMPMLMGWLAAGAGFYVLLAMAVVMFVFGLNANRHPLGRTSATGRRRQGTSAAKGWYSDWTWGGSGWGGGGFSSGGFSSGGFSDSGGGGFGGGCSGGGGASGGW